jgi:type IV secretory pathway protease TraF
MIFALLRSPLLLGGVALVAVLGFWRATSHAWSRGYAAAEAAQAAEVARLKGRVMAMAETASRAEGERLALEAERDALARELEELADADPAADRPALGLDSVRRLKLR